MITREIGYEVDDRHMIGTYAAPDGGGKHPAVLVSHEGPGLDDHARNVAKKLAGMGYAAFALDYHGGGKAETDIQKIMPRVMALIGNSAKTREIGKAGLDVLLAQPEADASKVAAIGYCFGGTLSFELARAGYDIKAAVGFHAGLSTTLPAEAGKVKAKLLALIGADDPLVPPEQRGAFEAEMRAAKADWQLVTYGGVQHSFTNEAAKNANIPGIVYDKAADERSWRAMLDLFDEVF